MKDNFVKLLPWVLLVVLILYIFCSRDNELNKALTELKTARNQVDSAAYKINNSLINLNQVRDSLDSFRLHSEILYTEFKSTTDQVRKDIQPVKRKIDSLRIILNSRMKQEYKDHKPIEVINQ